MTLFYTDESVSMTMKCWFPLLPWVLITRLQSITHIISRTAAHMRATQKMRGKVYYSWIHNKLPTEFTERKRWTGATNFGSVQYLSFSALHTNKEANSKSYRSREDSLFKAVRRRSDEETVLYYTDIDQPALWLAGQIVDPLPKVGLHSLSLECDCVGL